MDNICPLLTRSHVNLVNFCCWAMKMGNEIHRLPIDPKLRYGTVLWGRSLTMKCDFMMLAEPAPFDADFNPFCTLSAKAGDLRDDAIFLIVKNRSYCDAFMDVRTAVVQHRCSCRGFTAFLENISAMQTPAIAETPPAERLSAYGCNKLEEHHRNLWKFKLLLNCCQTAPRANGSVLTVTWGLCFFFPDTPHQMGRGSLQIAVISMKYEESLSWL